MAGLRETIRRKGFGPSGLCCVGLLLVSLLAVLPATAPAAITEFTVPTVNSQPAGITVGPDGALWFTEENGHKIGRITTDGAITEYQIPTVPQLAGRNHRRSGRESVVHRVRRQSTQGRPAHDRGHLHRMGAAARRGARRDHGRAGWGDLVHRERRGQDRPHHDRRHPPRRVSRSRVASARGHHPGARRAAVVHRIRGQQGWRGQARCDPGNQEYDVPDRSLRHRCLRRRDVVHHARSGQDRQDLPDRHPWDEFGPTGRGPSGIALGPDGALWFAETEADKIGRMTTTGRITEFALPPDPSGPNLPGEIVAGPDGAMWFTESGVNKIGRIDAGSPTSVFVPPPFVPPLQITTTKKSHAGEEECLPGAEGSWSADRAGPEEAAAREVQVPHPRQGPRVLDPPTRRSAHPRDGAAEGEAALA